MKSTIAGGYDWRPACRPFARRREMTTRGRRTATAGTRAKAVVDGTDERLEASHSALPAGIIPLLTVVEAARFLGCPQVTCKRAVTFLV